MALETVNYQCPSCGGALRFDGETGRAVCDSCDSSFSSAEVEAYYANKQNRQDQKAQANNSGARGIPSARDLSTDEDRAAAAANPIGEFLRRVEFSTDETKGLVAYTCSSCGAELMCDTTTAVTSCPYCSNPTVAPGQLSGVLKPDYVIPFKKTKDDAIAALKSYYKGKKFLPKEFINQNHVEEIQGLYVPFWLYDGEVFGDAIFDATEIRTWSDSRFMYTETTRYELARAGHMGFVHVPADGSVKMPDAHMDAVEPYDYSEMVPFSMGYLPGFITDRFDVDADECKERIEGRLAKSIELALENTAIGHGSTTTRWCNSQVDYSQISYALLPVWMLHTRFEDADYLFAMNGQTGKMIGDLPTSKGKIAAWFIGLTVIISIIIIILALIFFN
jgi:uncharacterized Zn finger protein (UPF0148 family)